jgi:hypothetical protein
MKYIITSILFGCLAAFLLSSAKQANQKPTPQADTCQLYRVNVPSHFNLLSNDSDPDGDNLKIIRYVLNGVTYTPRISERNLDSITIQLSEDGSGYIKSYKSVQLEYTVSDGHRGTATSTLTAVAPPPPSVSIDGWIVKISTYNDFVMTFSLGFTLAEPFAQYTNIGHVSVTREGLFIFRPLASIHVSGTVYVNGYKIIIFVR